MRWKLDHLVGWRTSIGALSRRDANGYDELSGLEAIMRREIQPSVVDLDVVTAAKTVCPYHSVTEVPILRLCMPSWRTSSSRSTQSLRGATNATIKRVLAAEYAVLAQREVELMDAMAGGCLSTVAVGLKEGAQLPPQLGVATV